MAASSAHSYSLTRRFPANPCCARPKMELPPALRLSFENNPSAQDRRAVEEALGAYNAPFLRNPPYSYFGIFIRHEINAIRSGLNGICYSCWLFIDLLRV